MVGRHVEASMKFRKELSLKTVTTISAVVNFELN